MLGRAIEVVKAFFGLAARRCSAFCAGVFLPVALGVFLLSVSPLLAATPGLPFTEDFSDQSLMDGALTKTNWSVAEQAVYLVWRQQRIARFSATGTAIGSETDSTRSVTLGDVDQDGDPDLVAGNDGQTNKLYLNDGSGGFSATGAFRPGHGRW